MARSCLDDRNGNCGIFSIRVWRPDEEDDLNPPPKMENARVRKGSPRFGTRLSIQSILVLCEGNHCRSPMAEGLLRDLLGAPIRIDSAGVAAQEGFPPHPSAVALMEEHGIDISSCRSRQATAAMVLGSELTLVMDQKQKSWCESLAPSARGRVFLLGSWLPPGQQEIADPNGQGAEAFKAAFEQISRAIASWQPHFPRTQSPDDSGAG